MEKLETLELAEVLSVAFYAYTYKNRELIVFNKEAQKLFVRMGINEHNILTDLMKTVPEGEKQALIEKTKSLKKTGDMISYIYHPITTDGTYLTLKCDTKLLSFANGQEYILTSVVDITEQELIKMRLEEEQRQYQSALAYDSILIFSLDLTEGVFRHEIISKYDENMADVIGVKLPADYDTFANAWLSDHRIITDNPEVEIVKNRKSLMDAFYRGISLLEFEYYVPERGKYYRVLTLLYKIREHISAGFIIYDVTIKKEEEKQKRDIISSLGKIYSALYHFSLTEDKYVVLKQHKDIQSEFERIHNFSDFAKIYSEQFAEEGFKELVAEFLKPENIQKNLADKESVSIEYRRKEFGWCSITLVVSGRDSDGRVTSIVLAGYIIEERKQAELAQQDALKAAYEAVNFANSAKSIFLANMSHDIRTPLNAITGLTAIMGQYLDDKEKLFDCMSKITISSNHLLAIINEVLEMSKIESGVVELLEEEIRLPELFCDLLAMTQAEVNEKKHSVKLNMEGVFHDTVYGDGQRIQQVFMNLMNNAIKYTPSGGTIEITISEKLTNKENVSCYEFVFADNGIGMREDFIEHIFEPFVRADNDERVDKIQGTGLGMSITKNIVQMMNGDIKVSSQLNAGTKIVVTLFLKIREKDVRKTNTPEQASSAVSDISMFCPDIFAGHRVLLVEDNDINADIAGEIFKIAGITVDYATNGKEAVDMLQRAETTHLYDIVFMDIRMPIMDGYEAAKAIRALPGAYAKSVPIVAMTANAFVEDAEAAINSGMNAHIAKPLNLKKLFEVLERWLGK
ncbi:MAG: ATP-binding protein [Eubacteriales bacterium]|nr:ATP-binding protein [Eubacteriales bacterium]